VAVQVGRGHADAAAKGRGVGVEAAQGAADRGRRAVGDGKGADVRAAARVGPGDDLERLGVRVDLPDREVHAAGELRVVGVEIGDDGRLVEEQVLAVVNLDVRRGPGAGGDDYVIEPVAVHVAGGHADTAQVRAVVGGD